MKIILINGKKRSGKDYFASKVKEELYLNGFSSEIMAFADPIKDIIATTFEISPEKLDKYKNYKAAVILDEDWVTNMRAVLQHFGTEAMKKWFGETVWVDLLEEKAHNANVDYVIVPDFRFLSEAISEITVHVKNDSNRNASDSHASENELNDFEFKYEIDNTGYGDISKDVKTFVKYLIDNP